MNASHHHVLLASPDVESAPIHGLPRDAGQPIRPMRVPMHLRPPGYGGLCAEVVRLLCVLRRAQLAGQPLGLAALAEAIGTGERQAQHLLSEARRARMVRSSVRLPLLQRAQAREEGAKGRARDYSQALTPRGVVCADAAPAVLADVSDRQPGRADEGDMLLLEELRRRHARGRAWVPQSALRDLPGLCAAHRSSIPRCHASGLIERVREAVGVRMWLRLAPEVQVAWGCVCLPGGAS
jgi:hypothetical protein